MTVKELKDLLEDYPDDLEVMYLAAMAGLHPVEDIVIAADFEERTLIL